MEGRQGKNRGETVSESDTKCDGKGGGQWVEARSYTETLGIAGVKMREFLVLSLSSS